MGNNKEYLQMYVIQLHTSELYIRCIHCGIFLFYTQNVHHVTVSVTMCLQNPKGPNRQHCSRMAHLQHIMSLYRLAGALCLLTQVLVQVYPTVKKSNTKKMLKQVAEKKLNTTSRTCSVWWGYILLSYVCMAFIHRTELVSNLFLYLYRQFLLTCVL